MLYTIQWMVGRRKHHGLLVEEIFKDKIDVKNREGSMISPYLKAHSEPAIASWMSQRTRDSRVGDKGQFITATASHFHALIPKLKFSGAHTEETWAQGTQTFYIGSKHVCPPLWRETLCLSSKASFNTLLKEQSRTKAFILKTYKNAREPWRIISQQQSLIWALPSGSIYRITSILKLGIWLTNALW